MDSKYIGLINQHLIFNTDDSNITSKNNSYIYNQILDGNYESPAFDYLNNMGIMRINDVKSIGMYNETNLAARMYFILMISSETQLKILPLKDV